MNGERGELSAAVNRRAQLIPVLRFFGEEMPVELLRRIVVAHFLWTWQPLLLRDHPPSSIKPRMLKRASCTASTPIMIFRVTKRNPPNSLLTRSG
jgi:hypothetical protein